jgi:hypothetical protein
LTNTFAELLSRGGDVSAFYVGIFSSYFIKTTVDSVVLLYKNGKVSAWGVKIAPGGFLI